MWAAPGKWIQQGCDAPLEPSEGPPPRQRLNFGPGRPILNFRPPEL